jgi:predicted metalloprotease with PDZ domain
VNRSYRSLQLAMCWMASAAVCAGQAHVRPVGTTGSASLCYTVSVRSPESQRVAVTVALAGVDPLKTSVRWEMQQRFAFVRLPEPLLDGPIRATVGGQVVPVQRRSAYDWDLPLSGQHEIVLHYVVPLTHRTLDAVKSRDAYEYPYLAPDHGLLVTPTLFVYPADIGPLEIRVRFDLPVGWEVVSPWRAVGEHEFDPGERESLLNDLVAIGNWHTHAIRAGDFVGTIAFAPGQEPLEKAAVEPIRRVVERELELFGRPADGRYLFVFGRPDTSGMAGSPKTHAMTLSVEPRLAEAASRYLPHLIAHEFFHTWMGAQFEMPDELRWVNEGFTDYFAYLVPARLGLSTWDEFADTLADKMRACAENLQRGKLSLASAGGEVFFTDRNAYDLVYDGGLVIAAWLDQAIRRQGRGQTLDDLMRAFNNDPRWTKGEATPSARDFFEVVGRFAEATTAAQLERFVVRPYEFDPPAAFAELGLTIRREEAPAPMDLRANFDGTRVIDIDPGSGAYRVGIRANDRLIEINGQSVSDAREVRVAWQRLVDKGIRVTLERNGDTLALAAPVPRIERFIVPVEAWGPPE